MPSSSTRRRNRPGRYTDAYYPTAIDYALPDFVLLHHALIWLRLAVASEPMADGPDVLFVVLVLVLLFDWCSFSVSFVTVGVPPATASSKGTWLPTQAAP